MATKGDTQKIPSILRRIFRSRTWFFKTIRTRTRLRTTILFQFRFRTRTRTNFWEKSVPVHYYVPKINFFPFPSTSTFPYMGTET